jgi:hypothetical protein
VEEAQFNFGLKEIERGGGREREMNFEEGETQRGETVV